MTRAQTWRAVFPAAVWGPLVADSAALPLTTRLEADGPLNKEHGETNRTFPTPKDASRQYAAAHAAHYTNKNLREAIEHYNGVIVAHPDSPEAGYSRTQILNIANRVISKDALLEAHMTLALAELDDRHSDIDDAVLAKATS